MESFTAYVFDGINRLSQTHSGMFESMGLNLCRGFAGITVSWFCIQSALKSAGGGEGFHWGKFVNLLQEILIVHSMVTFYTTPLPVIGESFTHLVLNQVHHMVTVLEQTRVQEIMDILNQIEMFVPFPGPWEVFQILRVLIIQLCIIFAQGVTLGVIMYGYVATAVIVLFGPLFIPFKIFPQMEWMFWGWLRAFIQYAFYQLIATAYVFVFGEFLIGFLQTKAGPMSNEDIGYLFVPLVLALVTFALGVIKIPALTFSIFSGRSGDYVLPKWS